MLRKYFFALLRIWCILFLPAVVAYAQENDSLHYVLDEVVAVDSKDDDVVSVPLQSLGLSDIKRLGLQNLSDAVKRMSGVDVHDYGGVGGLKTVSVRGMGAKHTAVSYDGVVVSDALSGMVDLGRFRLDNVSGVSLAVGENGGGVLCTAREYASSSLLAFNSLFPLSGLHCDVKLQGGSFGLAALSLYNSYATASGSCGVTFAGNYLRSDGAYPFVLVNGNSSSREKRKDGDVESLMLEGNVKARLFGGFLSGKVYYYDSERGLPGAVNLYNKNYSERLWSRNVFAQFNGLFPLSSSVDMRVVMKYDYNRSLYKEVNADYASGEQVDKNVQNESYLSLAVGGNAWRGLSYSVAADVSYATLENNFVDSKAPRRFSSYTLFSAKYEWKKIMLSASLLALYMNDKVENGVSPEFYKRFSPSFSVVLRSLCGYEPLSLRFSYKDAYRVPTFADLYYLRLGNVGLKPERASQFNVGVVWGVRSSEALEKLDFTVDAYYNKVRDKIVALPTMYIWRMMNLGKTDICGIDLNASVGVALLPGFKLLADVNYSWQHAVDVTDKSAKNYRDQLPYTPRHSGNFSLTFENPLVNASYMLSAVGKRYMLPQNTAKNRMVGYVEHSFSLNREFAFDDMMLRLQGELLNVGDEQYEVIRYYPMPGFSWRLSVSLAF